MLSPEVDGTAVGYTYYYYGLFYACMCAAYEISPKCLPRARTSYHRQLTLFFPRTRVLPNTYFVSLRIQFSPSTKKLKVL